MKLQTAPDKIAMAPAQRITHKPLAAALRIQKCTIKDVDVDEAESLAAVACAVWLKQMAEGIAVD